MMVQLLGQMGVGGRVKEDIGEILDSQKTFHLDFSASEKHRQSPQTQRQSKQFAVDKELSLEPRHPCFTAAGRLVQGYNLNTGRIPGAYWSTSPDKSTICGYH